ncbi:MAG: hypothetical protein JW765_09940 [Deltaproteobacteria bacterium]|nr:hypothetical protein [Candidatus Zymogenaceae bacterium]
MDAEVRFLDGETRSFPGVGSMEVRDDAIVLRRWFRAVAIIPVDMIRWARLARRRKVSQRDFGKAAL